MATRYLHGANPTPDPYPQRLVRPEGFEPSTCRLRVGSSTIELRARGAIQLVTIVVRTPRSNPAVTVCAANVALLYFVGDLFPGTLTVDQRRYVPGFLAPDVIELEDQRIGFATVHARVLEQVVVDASMMLFTLLAFSTPNTLVLFPRLPLVISGIDLLLTSPAMNLEPVLLTDVPPKIL